MMLWHRLQSLIPRYRRAQEREMQEELAVLEQMTSRRELGNLTVAAENAREVLGFPFLDTVGADIRYSFRSLRRDRVFTTVAVLSLALGIAANVGIFGIMDALLWRELPVRHPDQLVSFENTSQSYFGYTEFARHSAAALQDVFAQSPALDTAVEFGSGPHHVQAEFISGNYFTALGVTPVCGRLILPSDEQREHPETVVVLRSAYWRQAFHRDPSVVGRSLRVGEGPFEVIGVAPDEFFGLSVGEAPDIWMPLTSHPLVFAGTNWLSGRNTNWLEIFGRLRPGMSLHRAEAILTPVSLEIDSQRNGHVPTPTERKQMLQDPIRLKPAAKGISYLRNRFSQPLQVIFSMFAVGLFLACLNVVSLQIARTDERRRELIIRLALGASRFRIVRQSLTEALMLASISSLLGVFLFQPLANSFVSLISIWGGEPARLLLTMHAELLTFVVFLCLAVTLLSGLLPAFYASPQEIQTGLQTRSLAATVPRNHRMTARVVGVTQLAVSLVLITGACLFGFSLHQLRRFDGGIKRDRLMEMEIDVLKAGYQNQQAILLDNRLRDRFAATPGIESVTFSQNGIYSGRNFTSRFEADGFHPLANNANYGIYDYVGPQFFTTLGTTVLAGRDFDERDTTAAPQVIIVNQTFANRIFPHHDALGRNVYVLDQNEKKAYQIVGIVHDVRTSLRDAQLMWYLPALQHKQHAFSTRFLIRARNKRHPILPDLRAVAQAEDTRLQIEKLETADNLLDRTLDTDRLLARLGWSFGALALLLASVGIYGLLSYDVAKRTAEIGIRTALGAQRPDIMRLVLSEVAVVLSLGLATGGTAALLLAKFVCGLVFGIEASDFRMELFAAATLILVALVAAAIPARRAAQLDPMRALRAE